MISYSSDFHPFEWKKKRKAEEQQLQTKFMEWLGLQYPKVWRVTFSIPNEGRRSYNVGKKMKSAGMKKGVPDLFIAYPTQHFHGLFVEFKSDKGKVSEHQENMMSLLREQKYETRVIFKSLDDAINMVNEYLGV